MINQKECVVIIVNLQAILFRRQSWGRRWRRMWAKINSYKKCYKQNQNVRSEIEIELQEVISGSFTILLNLIQCLYRNDTKLSLSLSLSPPKTTTIPVIPLIKPGETFFYLSSSLDFFCLLPLFLNSFTTTSTLILWLWLSF